MSLDFAADLDLAMQGNEHPLVSLTYTQGSATKAITKAWRTDALRRGPEGIVGLSADTAEFVVPQSQFTSGFAGGASASISPGENDSITIAGERPWDVVDVQSMGAGAWWLVTCDRTRSRGTA